MTQRKPWLETPPDDTGSYVWRRRAGGVELHFHVYHLTYYLDGKMDYRGMWGESLLPNGKIVRCNFSTGVDVPPGEWRLIRLWAEPTHIHVKKTSHAVTGWWDELQ